jgi:hypothetical protein
LPRPLHPSSTAARATLSRNDAQPRQLTCAVPTRLPRPRALQSPRVALPIASQNAACAHLADGGSSAAVFDVSAQRVRPLRQNPPSHRVLAIKGRFAMNPSNDGACFARLRANTGSATQRHLPAYWLDGREDGALSWNAAVTSRSFCQTKLQIIHKTRKNSTQVQRNDA